MASLPAASLSNTAITRFAIPAPAKVFTIISSGQRPPESVPPEVEDGEVWEEVGKRMDSGLAEEFRVRGATRQNQG